MTQGFFVGMEYERTESATIDYTLKETGEQFKGIKSDTSKATAQVGLKLGYKQIPMGGVGFDFGLSILKYEKPDEDSNFTNFSPTANLVLAAPQFIYASAGVNTHFITGASDGKFSSELGYQIGVGTIIANSFNFEIAHKWYSVEIEGSAAWVSAKARATNARLIYVF